MEQCGGTIALLTVAIYLKPAHSRETLFLINVTLTLTECASISAFPLDQSFDVFNFMPFSSFSIAFSLDESVAWGLCGCCG